MADNHSNDNEPPASAYDDGAPTPELTEFYARADLLLQPSMSEMLTEETRKTQRSLLIAASVVVLVASRTIVFEGEIDFAGFKFAGPTARVTILGMALIVTVYLELIAAARCFTEWQAWLLRTKAAATSAQIAFSDLMKSRPSGAQQHIWELHDHVEDSAMRYTDGDVSEADRLRYEAETNSRPTRDRERMRKLRLELAKSEWFFQKFRHVTVSRRFRYWLEVLFPLLAGAAAIVFGVLQLGY